VLLTSATGSVILLKCRRFNGLSSELDAFGLSEAAVT